MLARASRRFILMSLMALGSVAPAAGALYQLAPVADASVVDQYPSTNYGLDKDLFVHFGSTATKRTYLRFDLSSIPVQETIVGATLYMYSAQGGVATTTIDLHHVSDDAWIESSITWSSRPAFDAVVLASATTSPPGSVPGSDEMSWSLPGSVFAADTDAQLSLLLKLENESGSDTATFSSKESRLVNPIPPTAIPPALGVTTMPIPEPEIWAMLLAGLGVVAWASRKRQLAGTVRGLQQAHGLEQTA